MKRGKIDTDSIPTTELVNITIPIQIAIKNGEFSVMELLIQGEPVPHFRGLRTLFGEAAQSRRETENPTDW